VTGGDGSYIGGFVGQDSLPGSGESGAMRDVYEAGRVSAAKGTTPRGIGGFAGFSNAVSMYGAFYFTGTNPRLPAVGGGNSAGIAGASGLAISNLGYASAQWTDRYVCGRQQAVMKDMVFWDSFDILDHCIR
jgi:hypothetical protein